MAALGGARVAVRETVVETEVRSERRQPQDRRRHSRSGRRANDPHAATKWRRIAWLFAAYAAFLSLRTLPARLKGLFRAVKV